MVHNILILCHGMTILPDPARHDDEYDVLLSGLYSTFPELEAHFACTVRVEYGHELPRDADSPLRPDEKLTRAQRFIQESVSFEKIVQNPSPEDELLPPGSEFVSSMLRPITGIIRDTVVALGLTDAIYYASNDGEQAVRQAVYGQVIDALDSCGDQDEVRLHVVTHSLGSTVLFDFLFGLFASPSFYRQGGEPALAEHADAEEKAEARDAESRYAFWRSQAERQDQAGRLKLGSLTTLGGQIPFFFMRKQALIDQLARSERLDPENIGVPRQGPPTWKIFYDVDDVLGYPVRGLFEAEGSIRQYQVDSHFLPHLAHTRYWHHLKVLNEIGELLTRTTDAKTSVGLRLGSG